MTHHKLWSSSLQATGDARSSCEFLKVVGYSCHRFSHCKLLHTGRPHPVLMRPGAQITGVRIPSLPCFQTLLEQEPGRNPCSSAFGQEMELQHHLPWGGGHPPVLPQHPLPGCSGLGRARAARAPCGISAEVSVSAAFSATGLVLLGAPL